jgi:hypothetical protein
METSKFFSKDAPPWEFLQEEANLSFPFPGRLEVRCAHAVARVSWWAGFVWLDARCVTIRNNQMLEKLRK